MWAASSHSKRATPLISSRMITAYRPRRRRAAERDGSSQHLRRWGQPGCRFVHRRRQGGADSPARSRTCGCWDIPIHRAGAARQLYIARAMISGSIRKSLPPCNPIRQYTWLFCRCNGELANNTIDATRIIIAEPGHYIDHIYDRAAGQNACMPPNLSVHGDGELLRAGRQRPRRRYASLL